MPMPPQLARFCFEGQQLYSESLLNDEIPHPALRKRPAFKEADFCCLHLQSQSFSPKLRCVRRVQVLAVGTLIIEDGSWDRELHLSGGEGA